LKHTLKLDTILKTELKYTLKRNEEGTMSRDIVLGVPIHADVEMIRRAITTQEGLSSFWTPTVTAEPTVGSEATFGFAGAPVDLTMRVDRIEDDSVAWTCLGKFPFWEGTTVTWTLSPETEHGGTNVLFVHAGFSEEQPVFEHGSIAHTWATILDRLQVLAETGAATPALT
jgi:uncharacterized protein YndB with AHSA1/START domain